VRRLNVIHHSDTEGTKGTENLWNVLKAAWALIVENCRGDSVSPPLIELPTFSGDLIARAYIAA